MDSSSPSSPQKFTAVSSDGPASPSFDFVNRANAEYIDQMFAQYQRDPRSVPEAWRAFFAGFEVGVQRAEGDRPALPTAPLNLGVYDMVHSYRELGHFVARRVGI